MKKLVFIMFFVLVLQPVFSSSINNAAYKTMQASSYRNNYNRQVNNRVIPYWQVQSNYSTRNRIYQNYSQYNNNLYDYTNVRNNYRGYR